MKEPRDPLSPGQLETLRDSVVKPSSKVPINIVAGTGLYPNEFVHLHYDWIEFSKSGDKKDHPVIRIPDNEPCRRKKVERGRKNLGEFGERDQPCIFCRHRGDEDQFNAIHRSDRNRTITVVDSYAAEMLEWWFKRFNTIPWGMNSHPRHRAAAVEIIDRPVNLTGLRHTFAARAGAMGLGQSTIIDYLGLNREYPTNRIYQILQKASLEGDDYDGWRKQRSFRSYLSLLDSNKPLTVREIADEFSVSKNTVRTLMRKYEHHELVVCTQVDPKQHGKKKWTNIAKPDTLLECPSDNCEEQFHSLYEKSRHLSEECEL